jgi:serine/threonine protein phosphatase PrpC
VQGAQLRRVPRASGPCFLETVLLAGSCARRFIIVACDGVWDVIEDQAAVDLVRCLRLSAWLDAHERGPVRTAQVSAMLPSMGSVPEAAAQRCAAALVQEALRRGTTDNVTALVLIL